MSLETVHPGVWIFLAVASVAIIWFLGKSPLDEERQKAAGRIEKLAGCMVIALLAALVAAVVIVFAKKVWEPL